MQNPAVLVFEAVAALGTFLSCGHLVLQKVSSGGLVLQATGTGDVVIALRGSEGIMEWVQDVRFLAVPCPFLVGAGNTEHGFTAVYNSLSIAPAAGSSFLIKALNKGAADTPLDQTCDLVDDLRT
jgi:hypothetical protein